MTLIASLVPIALYLVVLRAMDAFSLARVQRLASSFLWGVASVGITLSCVYLWRWTHHGTPWHQVWISPLLEETIKALPLLWFVHRRRVVFLAETLIYGQMIGAGFAVAENILYLSSDLSMGTALVRGIGTSMLHMGCTASLGSMALVSRIPMQHDLRPALRRLFGFFLPLVLVPSVLIHMLHNMLLIPPVLQLGLVVITFMLLFLFLEWINERIIIRWLDISLTTDVTLLASLHKGTFTETPTGQYLISIRDHFEPLVFFDLCAYLTLYLQLLVKAKSWVMLRDAGIDMPLSVEERQDIRAQLTELDHLAHNLPRLAHQLLRPILHTSDQNLWAMRTMGK